MNLRSYESRGCFWYHLAPLKAKPKCMLTLIPAKTDRENRIKLTMLVVIQRVV